MLLFFWPASYRSMAASSLVDFVFGGFIFYGSTAIFNQHFMLSEVHNRFYLNCVAWMLLSGHQKLGHTSSPVSGPSSHGRITGARVSHCL